MTGALSRDHVVSLFLAAILLLGCSPALHAQANRPAWTTEEKPIYDQIRHLRDLPDDVRARTTQQLALKIRPLPVTPTKLILANALANLSTEGDFGHDTLQDVATTLADALRERPVPQGKAGPAAPYVELAELVRYEHVEASLDDPQFAAAMSKLETDDANRQNADFTLSDLRGKVWTLRELRGKVVLVNFWATWCPPCVEETPSLIELNKRISNRNGVVLGVSVDEDDAAYQKFIQEHGINFPTSRDGSKKSAQDYGTVMYPETYIIDRHGKIARKVIGPQDWNSAEMVAYFDNLLAQN